MEFYQGVIVYIGDLEVIGYTDDDYNREDERYCFVEILGKDFCGYVPKKSVKPILPLKEAAWEKQHETAFYNIIVEQLRK